MPAANDAPKLIDACDMPLSLMDAAATIALRYGKVDLPKGYATNGNFGPRVLKYDWKELTAYMPLLNVYVTAVIVIALFGLLWLLIFNFSTCFRREDHNCYAEHQKNLRNICTGINAVVLIPLFIGTYILYLTFFEMQTRSEDFIRPFGELNEYFTDTQTVVDKYLVDNYKNLRRDIDYDLNYYLKKMRLNNTFDTSKLDFTQNQRLCKNLKKSQKLIVEMQTKILEFSSLMLEVADIVRIFYRNFTVAMEPFATMNETLPLWKELGDAQNATRYNCISIFKLYKATEKVVTTLEAACSLYEHVNSVHKSLQETVNIVPTVLTSTIGNALEHKDAEFSRLSNRLMSLVQLATRAIDKTPKSFDIKLPYVYIITAMITVIDATILTAALSITLLCGVLVRPHKRPTIARVLMGVYFFNCLSIIYIALQTAMHFMVGSVLHSDICHKKGSKKSSMESEPYFVACAPNVSIYTELLERGEIQPMTAKMPPQLDSFGEAIKSKIENISDIKNAKYLSNSVRDMLETINSDSEKLHESPIQLRLLLSLNQMPGQGQLSFQGSIHQMTNPEDQNFDGNINCLMNMLEGYVSHVLVPYKMIPITYDLNTLSTKLIDNNQMELGPALLEANSEIKNYIDFYTGLASGIAQEFLLELTNKFDEHLSNYVRETHKALETEIKSCHSVQKRHLHMEITSCRCLELSQFGFTLGTWLVVLGACAALMLSAPLVTLYKKRCADEEYPPIARGRPPNSDSQRPAVIPKKSQKSVSTRGTTPRVAAVPLAAEPTAVCEKRVMIFPNECQNVMYHAPKAQCKCCTSSPCKSKQCQRPPINTNVINTETVFPCCSNQDRQPSATSVQTVCTEVKPEIKTIDPCCNVGTSRPIRVILRTTRETTVVKNPDCN